VSRVTRHDEPLRERLRTGPAIVGDGGMGALVTSAVQRCAAPRRRTSARPRASSRCTSSFINAGAELIETNTFGANRPKLAAAYLEDEFERINSRPCSSRARRGDRRPRRLHRAARSAARRREPRRERAAALFAEQARSSRAAAPTSSWSRRSTTSTSSTRDRRGRSVSSLPIVALLTFDEGAETLAASRRGGGRAARRSTWPHRREPRRGPARALAALEAMAPTARRSRRCRTSASRASPAAASSTRTPRPSTSRVRGPRAPARRGADRRLLRHDAAEIAAIRSAVDEERQPHAALHVVERELRRPAEHRRSETELAQLWRGRVGRLGAARPAARRQHAACSRRRASSRPRRGRFVDINDNPMARARMSALMASVAIERDRHRDDPAPHTARHDDQGLESHAARRARGGRPQRPRGHGDPPEVGDYPGSRGVYEVDSIGSCS
jgi:homocysteine S-methyltransferase